MLLIETERKKLSAAEREYLFKTQKKKCMYCGKKRDDSSDFHDDHKTPLKRGGSNTLGNRQLICMSCNSRKGALTDGEFRKKYKLTPSKQVKGPPKTEIPQKHFKDIQEEIRKKKAKKNKNDDWLLDFKW